ncbi:MAG: hypothetical protein HKN82_02155 [Akkermansiaceae bacterium]|nr:hypothetical protein [Akkermansiaceae bacterium]NNM29834.1 hypothetical protein [Akkermansiaceae bacterium]
MHEQTRTTTHTTQSPAGPGIFDDPDAGQQGGAVRINSGLHSTSLPVGGLTVGQIRERYADVLEIGPQNTAVIDGQPVGDETIVRVGQNLLFVEQAGEKGRGRIPPRAA